MSFMLHTLLNIVEKQFMMKLRCCPQAEATSSKIRVGGTTGLLARAEQHIRPHLQRQDYLRLSNTEANAASYAQSMIVCVPSMAVYFVTH